MNRFVFGLGNCSLGLFAGLDYLFFIQDEQSKLVSRPSGSRALLNLQGNETVKLLTTLRRLRDGAGED